MLPQLESNVLTLQPNFILLQSVLESLLDGVLILTQQGDPVYMNDAARRICQQMNQGQPIPPIPKDLWRICETLLDHPTLYPNQAVALDSEITLGKFALIRIRVRWLPLEDSQQPYLIVMLEDCYQSLQSRAIAEIQQFGLTRRQAEVWLLHRTGYSYQEIARELYISFNTVKKHIKDIYAKLPKTGDD